MAPAVEAGMAPAAIFRGGGRGARVFDPVLGVVATLLALAIAWGYIWGAHPSPSASRTVQGPREKKPVFARVAEARVPLREGPSTETRILRVLTKGTRVAVIDRRQEWCFVTVEEPALKGWIACRLLAFQ